MDAPEQPKVQIAEVAQLDEKDKALLNALQWNFPLTPRPFATIGEPLGLSESQTVNRIAALRDARVIRQISAIFDSRRLGYRSSLVAMRLPADREARAVEIVNAHPGVSHNYQRNHPFNMWFTLTVHWSRDLQAEMEALREASGAETARLLPTLKLFKINVKLDVTGATDATAREETKHHKPTGVLNPLTVDDVFAIRELQRDLPDTTEPFAPAAARLGIPVEQLLDHARGYLENGRMRRFAAVLHHQTAGFTHNAMSVWECPEEDIERCGRIIAGFKSISHAYRRPTYEDWPYSLFGMIHGRSFEDCRAVAEAIRKETGLDDYALLYSTREWKKVRVQYFIEEDMTPEEMVAPI